MKSLFVHCQYLAVLLAIGGLGVSSLGFAGVAPANPFQNIEFSVAGGPSWNHIHDTSLLISSYETDNVLVSHVSTTGVWKIGAGYHLLSPALEKNTFLNDLLVELNLYRSSFRVTGSVWQYQLAQFNNFSFSAPITSTRLMLDVKPSLVTWHCLSLYPILGAGIGWNSMTYHETVTGDGVDPLSNLWLRNRTTNHVAYDLGVGTRFALNSHLGASLEYLYTEVGSNVTSYATSQTPAAIVSAPRFKVSSQALLLGLNWTI
jgi:opacity protein-like surface antigen